MLVGDGPGNPPAFRDDPSVKSTALGELNKKGVKFNDVLDKATPDQRSKLLKDWVPLLNAPEQGKVASHVIANPDKFGPALHALAPVLMQDSMKPKEFGEVADRLIESGQATLGQLAQNIPGRAVTQYSQGHFLAANQAVEKLKPGDQQGASFIVSGEWTKMGFEERDALVVSLEAHGFKAEGQAEAIGAARSIAKDWSASGKVDPYGYEMVQTATQDYSGGKLNDNDDFKRAMGVALNQYPILEESMRAEYKMYDDMSAGHQSEQADKLRGEMSRMQEMFRYAGLPVPQPR
jgi:hypothetical protein